RDRRRRTGQRALHGAGESERRRAAGHRARALQGAGHGGLSRARVGPALLGRRDAARTIQPGAAPGGDGFGVQRMARVEPVRWRSHARPPARHPERRARDLRRRPAPEDARVDDSSGQKPGREMNLHRAYTANGETRQNDWTAREHRAQDDLSNAPNTEPPIARRRSAELHSAVSQIFNLRGAREFQSRSLFQRPADCKSAIQQIRNLHYRRGEPPQASIDNADPAIARKRSAELHSAVSQIFNLRGAREFQSRSLFQRPADCKSAIQQIRNLRYRRGEPPQASIDNADPAIARKRSAELHSAVSQIFNLRGAREFQSRSIFQRPADCKSAIQQVENLRYVSALPRQALLHFQS